VILLRGGAVPLASASGAAPILTVKSLRAKDKGCKCS
jgi:hypothetical protein